MTYESFKQQLADSLREFFPAGTQISIRPLCHNNHFILDGLTVMEPGCNISPTIYLNHYFESYQKGTAFSSVQQQILQYYHQHCIIQNIDTSFFTCFDHVQSRIVYKLVHYEKNRELLKEIPHFRYLDLAIVFYCLVPEKPYEHASIPIYSHHLDYWNISPDTLLLLAQKNTPLLLPWRFDSLADLILPALHMLPAQEFLSPEELFETNTVPMYVLTNRQQYFGASCLLYPNVLSQISQNFRDSLYVLPSSIHEVILIPASFAESPKELAKIVQEVNLTEVAQDEILSDSVYYYNHQDDKLTLSI